MEYGTIERLKTKNSTTGFKFTASPYSNQEFVVTFKDKYGKTWTTQPFNLVRPTSVISNISFTSTERSISLIWKPIPTNQKIIGYNVYRSLAENGTYTKLHPAPFATASMYSDNGLTPKTYYYYRISYVDNSGNESAMSSPTMAWTTLPFHDGWPIENSAIGFRISGSPNVIDIDNDGKKELFFAATSWGDKNIPAIFGFKHNGEELYDIDNNPTTLSGFAKFDENTYSTPALADIDNDGKIELVVSTGESGEKTYAYKITNIPNSPQLMWQTSTGESLSGNVVLAPFKGVSTSLEILPTNCYKGINQTQPILDNIGGLYRSIPGSAIDESGYKSGMHAVADIDNDGKQEIVMGHTSGITYCRKNAEGNYAQQWQYSNSTYPTATSPIVLADMDDDGSLDILFLMYNNLNKGVICIMRSNKTFLPGWDANNTEHIIDVKMPQGAYNRAPYISVGDVNSDGMPEVVIGGLGRLYAWKCNGVALPNFPITVANFYMGGAAPILADIDGEGDIDIICSSFDSNNLNANKIYAFHANGEAVKGFPLNIENSSTPCVADIDNDGKNELMARGSFGFYVWDTKEMLIK